MKVPVKLIHLQYNKVYKEKKTRNEANQTVSWQNYQTFKQHDNSYETALKFNFWFWKSFIIIVLL